MNGCRYCVIMHNRKRRGRKRARGVAMCLAQTEMARCEKSANERGPGCALHDAKAGIPHQPVRESKPGVVYLRLSPPSSPPPPQAACKAGALS
jgi:hypothetical protein